MNINSKRKDSTELPEIKELEAIMEKEAKRDIPINNRDKHFASFELPIQWLQLLRLPTDLFDQKHTWQDVVVYGAELQQEVVSRTLEHVEARDAEFEKLVSCITQYLGEEDIPRPSDSIFVFGSKNLTRIETAVDLYNKKLAPKIFISGGMPVYEKRDQSEAQIFRNWAIEHGVSMDAIATHDEAITVVDNVRGGLNTMDKLHLPYNSLILVTAWFAMKRSWAVMMKHVPENTKLYRVNTSVTASGNFTQDGWYKNEVGIKTIFNEFGKLKISELLNSS